ncbi:hypothetical protein [Pseudooceanicola algae]|uniref:HupE / UreJ protein n=1 Tax=Pseudooceanicola algae TaxID=1537215 RepID=A0A7T1FQ25_9RHOB|nr:hypothetical protein [Pseudooceanicola algae]QPM91556.1 hypothetical protein PSAL_028100 [Pseudooceanicola algae]
MRRSGIRLLLAALLAPKTALAHAGAHGPTEIFLDGALATLTRPEGLLPMLALGIGIALAGRDGLFRALPWMLAGLGAGVLAAGWIDLDMAALALVLGAALVLPIALLGQGLPRLATLPLAALTCGATTAGVLQGQGTGNAPLAETLGVFLTAPAPATLTFFAARLLLWPPCPRRHIALRIVASWITAIALMSLALLLRPI